MFKNINVLHKHCLSIIFALLIVVPFLTGFDVVREVVVKYDGQIKTVHTNLESPESVLQKAGVTLEPGDGWRILGANRKIQGGTVIEVVRAQSFIVVRDNEEVVYKSSKETVGEALKSLGISYRKNRIYPEADTKLEKDMKVYVLNKNEHFTFTEEEVAPEIEYIEDFNLPYGQQITKTEGKPGRATVISKVAVDRDGITVTQEIGSKVISAPENKVMVKGMGKSVKTPEGYKRYKKKMVVESTAYTINCGSGTGLTSIGLVPYEGIVAVDPRVIPYYTKMYIPGYGIAMAGDTGSGVVGNHVDVFMNDWHRAIQWGRKNIEIYILED